MLLNIIELILIILQTQDQVGACPKLGPTATDEIIRLFKEQQLHEKLEAQQGISEAVEG